MPGKRGGSGALRVPGGNRNGRRRRISFFVFILLVAFLAVPVTAHPPSAIALSYDPSAGQLTVDITHFVTNTSDHYIKEVVVRSGGQVVIADQYTSQPANARFTYQYPVKGQQGEVLEVTATCNKYGSLTEQLQVAALPSSAAASGIPSIWPLHMGLILVGFACIGSAVFIARTRRSTPAWFRMHKGLSHAGAGFVVAGLGVAMYMVAVSGGPHLRVPHAYIGGIAVLGAVTVLAAGIAKVYLKSRKPIVRSLHIRMGYLTAGLMAAGIATGIFLAFSV